MKRYIPILCFIFLFLGYGFALRAQITGKVTTDPSKAKYKANTVIYIDVASGTFSPPAKNPEIDQRNLIFIPHVLPIVAGTSVDFLNNDDVQHNIFSPDDCSKFNLGTWGKGARKSHKFTKVGCESVILCNVHPEMEAYVVVLQNTYYATTDSNGNFTINNVPPGTYTIKIWNEKLSASSQKITVPASGKLTVSFTLK